jgi:glycosyltransferase involved in cell wall biosynthesis
MPHSTDPLLYSFRFAHHGGFSSYHHLINFMPATYRKVVVNIGSSLLRRHERLQRIWLKVNEYRLAPSFYLGRRRCIHYLYPENSLFKAAQWSNGSDLVLTWHQPVSHLGNLPPAFRRKAVDALAKSAGVVFLSSRSRNDHEAAVSLKKSCVIRHGVDVDFFQYKTKVARGASATVITVGNCLRDYDCWAQTVQELTKRRGDIIFKVLCGANGARLYKEKLRTPMSNVQFLSGLDDNELLSFYHEADIAFLPLLDATANNFLLEAMACGIPCVVSDIPATKEYAGQSALYVENSDIRAVTQAITALADRLDLRIETSQAARAKVENELSWPIIARKHREFYESLSGC